MSGWWNDAIWPALLGGSIGLGIVVVFFGSIYLASWLYHDEPWKKRRDW